MNEELKSKFEEILNKQFEPNSETPLWACIALSSDKDAYFNAMQAAYNFAKTNEWVSVAERLPETEGYYLTWVNGFSRPIELYFGENKCFATADRSKVNVTHWQPLPTPPNQ